MFPETHESRHEPERTEIHVHLHFPDAFLALFSNLNRKVDHIMATQSEQTQTIKDLTAQVTKTRNETLAKIAALQAAIDAGGNSTPEMDAAMADLKAAVQLSDDDEPDAPAP